MGECTRNPSERARRHRGGERQGQPVEGGRQQGLVLLPHPYLPRRPHRRRYRARHRASRGAAGILLPTSCCGGGGHLEAVLAFGRSAPAPRFSLLITVLLCPVLLHRDDIFTM